MTDRYIYREVIVATVALPRSDHGVAETIWMGRVLPGKRPSVLGKKTSLFVRVLPRHCDSVISALLGTSSSSKTSVVNPMYRRFMFSAMSFWIFSISISAFICTKNYQKIFKTRECSSIGANVYICAKSGKRKSSSFNIFHNFFLTNDFPINSSALQKVNIQYFC